MHIRLKEAGALRIMLPFWVNAVWIVKIVKVVIVYFIYVESGTWIALGVFITPAVISYVLSLPHLCHLFHRFYLTIFEARLAYLVDIPFALSSEEAEALRLTINNAKSHHNIS